MKLCDVKVQIQKASTIYLVTTLIGRSYLSFTKKLVITNLSLILEEALWKFWHLVHGLQLSINLWWNSASSQSHIKTISPGALPCSHKQYAKFSMSFCLSIIRRSNSLHMASQDSPCFSFTQFPISPTNIFLNHQRKKILLRCKDPN